MSYTGFALTEISVFIALGLLLHLQFGRTGIVNFGVVGFVGIGMYGVAILTSTHGWGFWPALLATAVIAAVAASIIGWLLLGLSGDATLVGTLAFATIVFDLAITEKELTGGVAGLGGVPYPIDAGPGSGDALLFLLVGICALLVLYALRLPRVPYGRVLTAIKDNEPLASSLGKSVTRHKFVLFVGTAVAMAVVGGFYASANQFLVPRMLGPSLTFTIWIALILGGRARAFGPVLGVVVSVALFDLVVEPYLPVPDHLADLLPDIQLMLYGLVLVLVVLFRPAGLLGERKAVQA